MTNTVKVLDSGSVTSPKGFVAGATFAGLKTYAEDKLDLGILFSQEPCVAAGVFTKNRLRSPSVKVSEEHLSKGRPRARIATRDTTNVQGGLPPRCSKPNWAQRPPIKCQVSYCHR